VTGRFRVLVVGPRGPVPGRPPPSVL